MRQMQTNKHCAPLNLLLSLKKIFSLILDYSIHTPPPSFFSFAGSIIQPIDTKITQVVGLLQMKWIKPFLFRHLSRRTFTHWHDSDT